MDDDTTRAPDELHGDRFAIVPEMLLGEKSDVVKLYALLDRYANKDRRVWPGQAKLAEQMECSDRHVRRLLGTLQEIGALTEVKRRYNGSTVYRLCPSGLGSPVRPDRGVRSEPTDRTGESAPSGPGSPPNESHERQPPKNPIARTTISVPFGVSEAMQTWAATSAPNLDLEAETAAFCDHHAATGSEFKDWTAAWRKWMRNAEKYRAERSTNGNGSRVANRPTSNVERSWNNILEGCSPEEAQEIIAKAGQR